MRRDVRDPIPVNFTLKMAKSRIDTKIPIQKFEAKDPETGETILDKDGKATYMTFPEFLLTKRLTIEAYSTDNYFVKSLADFTYSELKEMEAELLKQGLTEGVDYWFLAHKELRIELAKDEWNYEPEAEVTE